LHNIRRGKQNVCTPCDKKATLPYHRHSVTGNKNTTDIEQKPNILQKMKVAEFFFL